MLPQAKPASIWLNARFAYQLRNSCYLTQLTRSLTRQVIPPPAGWKKLSFFTKNLHKVQIFREKRSKCTMLMLPQAILAFRSDTRMEQAAPRNSCYMTRLTRSVPNPGVCRDNWPDSPPAGWNGTFFFRKKTKKYHAAAGEIRRYREQTVRLNAHRVTLVT